MLPSPSQSFTPSPPPYGEEPGGSALSASSTLARLGFPEAYLSSLKSRGIDSPLPLQEEVLEQGALLSGESCLISAPTASGKTLIAEWCALAQILKNKRVFYLVPTRALAEEKAREFAGVFATLGITSALSTGEYSADDQLILEGRVSLVVTVVEKAIALLAQSRLSWKAYGLFVVDEAHLLGDAERGPSVDFFLTQWKLHPERPQLLALSAVVGKPESVAGWLGVRCLLSTHRIAPLREGVCNLTTGIFTYRESQTRRRGEEQLVLAEDSESPQRTFWRLVKGLSGKEANRVLVFVSSRREAYQKAEEMLQFFEQDQSDGFRDESLKDISTKQDREIEGFGGFLERIRRVGVGVHTADLASVQRERAEQDFRSGLCLLLFATPTLEQGVNLAADVVVQEPMMFGEDASGVSAMTVLSASRFKNQGGRAGRARNRVGRSVLFARNATEQQQLWNSIVLEAPEALTSNLMKTQLVQFLAQQLASHPTPQTKDQLQQQLESTFAARDCSEAECGRAAELALGRGTELGLWRLETTLQAYVLTALGELLALHRVHPQTLLGWQNLMRHFAEQRNSDKACCKSALLWVLLDCQEGNRLSLGSSSLGFGVIKRDVTDHWEHCPLGGQVLKSIQENGGWTSSRKATLKQLTLFDRLLSVCSEQMSLSFLDEQNVIAGQLESALRQLSWLSKALTSVVQLLDGLAGLEAELKAQQSVFERMQKSLAGDSSQVEAEQVGASDWLATEQPEEESVDWETALDQTEEIQEAEDILFENEAFQQPDEATQRQANHSLSFALRHFGRVLFGESLIELTPLQFRLLAILALHPGEVVKYFEINRLMWPEEPKFDQQINYHRAKLEKALQVKQGTLIRCLSGHGLWLELATDQVALPSEVVDELGLNSLLNESE